jgi:VanZ family protein
MTAAVRRAWIPALLWLIVIAWESMFGTSGATGGLLSPIIHFFWPKITPPQFELVHAALRKAGHFVGYFVLSVFFFRAWWSVLTLPHQERLPSWRDMFRRWSLSAASVACASAVVVAALDEWNQALVPGRTSSIRDVILDSSAAVCAQMLIIAASRMRARSFNHGSARMDTDQRRTVVRSP